MCKAGRPAVRGSLKAASCGVRKALKDLPRPMTGRGVAGGLVGAAAMGTAPHKQLCFE